MRKVTNLLAILGVLLGTWFVLPASMQTTLANNAADMSGKIVMVANSATGRTVTNLFTFNRGAAVPFAVDAASLKVTNLDADKLDGLDSVRYRTITVLTTSTGNQNNFDPSGVIAAGYQSVVIYCNNASLLTITGFPAAGFDGQSVTLITENSGQVDLSYNSASSTAGFRLINFVTSGTTSLKGPNAGYASYVYNTTTLRWEMTGHDQGAWITPTFAAGNFVGNGTMTWTVASGDVIIFAYRLSGRTLIVNVQLDTTTITGTPNTALMFFNPAWGTFTATKTMANHASYIKDSGTVREGLFELVDTTHLGFVLSTGANWAAAADTTSVWGQIMFEVS